MRRMIFMIPLITLGFYVNAGIIHIPEEAPFIQAGIWRALPGDTILVAEGTYYENINFFGKAVTVASIFLMDGDTSHISRTIINGSQPRFEHKASTVLMVNGEDSTSVLCGFTITGGKGTNIKIDYPNCRAGGGILIRRSGGKIVNNIITRNRIDQKDKLAYGGGVFASMDTADRNLVIAENIIRENTLQTRNLVDGAGMSVSGGKSGRIIIRDNIIDHNTARSSGSYFAHGGGITLAATIPSQSRFVVRRNIISYNEIYGRKFRRPSSFRGYDSRYIEYGRRVLVYGGGMYIIMLREPGKLIDLNPLPILSDNIFSGNYSEHAGGGIAIVTHTTQSESLNSCPRPILMNNILTDNRSEDAAGMIVIDESPLIVNNVFRNDHSTGDSSEILTLGTSEVFTYKNEINGKWTGKPVLKLFGRYYLRAGNDFFRMDIKVRNASLKALRIPPPWRSWWAFATYGIVFVLFLLWYRRFLLRRAELNTSLEIARIEKEKVQEMDQMKSRFFANISHEFRTPLTLILGPLEKLDTEETDALTFKSDVIAVIRRNARRLHSLINQILDLSKLETGKLSLEVSEGDPGKFVRAIIMSFLSLAESKQIKYLYDLPEEAGKAYFDPDKVEKILTNLISNAFKFTPEGGEVSALIRYVHPGESETSSESRSGSARHLEIQISDTGKGIPADELDRIFDRFYMVSDSDSREEDGSGIGLALTKELVELHRGSIRVESQPGHGSTFTVRLPVDKENFRENEIVEASSEAPLARGDELAEKVGHATPGLQETYTEAKEGALILIVEDNVDLRTYINQNLNPSYRIMEAENGRTGLEKSIETIPDLVISDLMMPDMDGMEMCKRLKSDERTSHIPVILLTAKADRDSKLEGYETGADDYVIKPFDSEELLVRVKNLIEQRKKLRDRYRKEFLTEPSSLNFEPAEEEFINRVMKCIEQHSSVFNFNVESLGSELNLSRTQLYRKIMALTGYSPVELIRNTRLKIAARMFQSGHKNVSKVMYEVGISAPSYFTRSFRELFGMNPSEYIKNS